MRMFECGISEAGVQNVLVTGEEIATYPDDAPYASRLVLGWRDQQPVHVVVPDNSQNDEQIVITVYEPDPTLWSQDSRRRRI
jgi:hypothetical protein